MLPPNFGGCGGRYFPSMVVVALGEPGVPVVCCARLVVASSAHSKEAATSPRAASRRVIAKCFSIMGALRDQRDSRLCRELYDGSGQDDIALRGNVDARNGS